MTPQALENRMESRSVPPANPVAISIGRP